MGGGHLQRYRMEPEERDALMKLAAASGQTWVKVADPTLDLEQKKPVKRTFCYDRIFDTRYGRCEELKYALSEFDKGVSDEALDSLSEGERIAYERLLCALGLENLRARHVIQKGLFRNMGLMRRCVRWSCMDELATSLLNPKAVEKWNEDGHPRTELVCFETIWMETMDEFRERQDKPSLTEEEFDRISNVFRECLNMENASAENGEKE